MLLLQLSSAQGPDECCLAVTKALQKLQQEAIDAKVKVVLVEQEEGRIVNTLRSVLLALEGEQENALVQRWCGTIQWVCQSPYRPSHGRKNWFIGGACFDLPSDAQQMEIRFETMRASGAGGQHVNKTDSAVRAIHLATGISVKVQSERSQHANKKLALLLITHKLAEQQQLAKAKNKTERWMFHHQIERGNPKRIFQGMKFSE